MGSAAYGAVTHTCMWKTGANGSVVKPRTYGDSVAWLTEMLCETTVKWDNAGIALQLVPWHDVIVQASSVHHNMQPKLRNIRLWTKWTLLLHIRAAIFVLVWSFEASKHMALLARNERVDCWLAQALSCVWQCIKNYVGSPAILMYSNSNKLGDNTNM